MLDFLLMLLDFFFSWLVFCSSNADVMMESSILVAQCSILYYLLTFVCSTFLLLLQLFALLVKQTRKSARPFWGCRCRLDNHHTCDICDPRWLFLVSSSPPLIANEEGGNHVFPSLASSDPFSVVLALSFFYLLLTCCWFSKAILGRKETPIHRATVSVIMKTSDS